MLDSARRRPPATDACTEDPAIDLNALVAPFTGAAIVGLGLIALLLLLLTIVQARRLGQLQRRLAGLTRGADGQSLDAVLADHLERVGAVGRELDQLSARSAVLEAAGRRAIQRVGLVRFNPFEDTGGNQSFAVALMDAGGNGVVVSSLHSRTGTRVYAKAISEGRSDGALSAEETEALRLALAGPTGGVAGNGKARDRVAGPA